MPKSGNIINLPKQNRYQYHFMDGSVIEVRTTEEGYCEAQTAMAEWGFCQMGNYTIYHCCLKFSVKVDESEEAKFINFLDNDSDCTGELPF